MSRGPGWARTSRTSTTCGWPPGACGPRSTCSPASSGAGAALRTELSWIAGALGAVRDLDVQLERMDEMGQWVDPGAHGGPEERSPLFELRQLLEDERRAARRVLIDALDSARWDRLTSGLEAMVRQPPARRSALYRSPAVAEVVDLVEGRHRAVDKAARRAKRTGMAGDFHRLRIRCKRLRYSLEFTADLYEGSTERYTRRLARVQDRLGLMQDAEVATNRLLALARTGHGLPPTTVFAMGGVAERYRTEAAGLLDDMAKRLKVLGGGEWRSLAALMEERRDEARRRIPSLRLAPAPPPAPGGPAAPGPPGPSEPVDGAARRPGRPSPPSWPGPPRLRPRWRRGRIRSGARRDRRRARTPGPARPRATSGESCRPSRAPDHRPHPARAAEQPQARGHSPLRRSRGAVLR